MLSRTLVVCEPVEAGVSTLPVFNSSELPVSKNGHTLREQSINTRINRHYRKMIHRLKESSYGRDKPSA